MNLVKSRNRMLDRFVDGYKPEGLLQEYRTHRNSEHWRRTLAVEELCEYILYLEYQLEKFKYDIRT
jgi:hypothetical protein